MNTMRKSIENQFNSTSCSDISVDFKSATELIILNDAHYYSLLFKDINYYFHLTSFWRAISNDAVVFSCTDDKQLFGLAEPFDIQTRFNECFGKFDSGIISINKTIADAKVIFNSNSRIEIFVDSCGYEPWSFGGDGLQLMCLGGGELAIF